MAPQVGKLKGSLKPDMQLDAAPSALFDAVVALPSEESVKSLVGITAVVDWLRNAVAHLKAIGFNEEADQLDQAGIAADAKRGIVDIDRAGGLEAFADSAK